MPIFINEYLIYFFYMLNWGYVYIIILRLCSNMKFSKDDNDKIDKTSNREKEAIKKGGNKEKIKQARRRKRSIRS